MRSLFSFPKIDNSINWLMEKKHWRIKTQKKNLINKQRYFDYLPFDHNKFLSGRIANSLGILSPKFNLGLSKA